MTVGRVVSGVVATAAVAGCAVVVIGIGRADSKPDPRHPAASPVAAATSRPAVIGAPVAATSAAAVAVTSVPARPAARSTSAAVSVPAVTTPAPAVPGVTSRPATAAAPAHAAPAHGAARRPAAHAVPASHVPASHAAAPRRAAAPRGGSLPLHFSTGSATRVITVTASSYGSTTATLQPWVKQSGGGWKKQGSAIYAHIGADGMSTHPSETRSATPIGSFTLTQAFGYYRNPGSPLPYFATTMSDYWISSPGRLYNTHQRCGSCGYNNGVNERLATETPFYNYAVVIDYNTRNAPGGVRAGAGSAFFLHVTDGSSTAGCVAIPQSRLVPIMKWLNPRTHPRILIGVS